MSTERIAPTDAIAIIPKLSFSDALLSLRRLVTPMDKESKKGTAKTPVVTPEASNAIANICGEALKAMRSTKP